MKLYNLIFAITFLLLFASCDRTAINAIFPADNLCGKWELTVGIASSGDIGMKVQIQGDSAVVIDAANSAYQVGQIKWRNIIKITEGYSYDDISPNGDVSPNKLMLQREIQLFASLPLDLDVTQAERWVVRKYVPCNTVELTCGEFTDAITLANGPADIDYIVPEGCMLTSKVALTIEPGVTIAFADNSGLHIEKSSVFSSEGTSSEPISFQGLNTAAGSWYGIYIRAEGVSRLEHVRIKHAGQEGASLNGFQGAASLSLEGDMSFGMENSVIENGAGLGVLCRTLGFTSMNFTDVTISSHEDYPISLPLELYHFIEAGDFALTGNTKDSLFINRRSDGSALRAPLMRLKDLGTPYLLESGLHRGRGTLTIEEGVELIAQAGAGIELYNELGYISNLSVLGAFNNPVVIKGAQPIAGYWNGICLEIPPAQRGIVTYAEISDAGGNPIAGASESAQIYIKSGTIDVDKSTISNSKGCGLAASAGATLNERGNTYSQNQSGDVCN